jgi:hypothetical protein
MVTGEGLLALVAAIEPWVALALAAMLVAVGADAFLAARDEPARPPLDAPMSVRTERLLLAVVLVLGIAVRVVGWRSALTPAWWFSEVAVLPIDQWLHDGTLWEIWRRQLGATRIDVAYQATAVLPLLAGLQHLLGPRFGLSVLAGAIMGALAIVLAWALGRRMRSQAFGLAFAALVAFSPLQLMWSRLSAMCTEAIVHVLLAMLVGWIAGRRGSWLLAALAGLIAWTSFQQYYAARVSVPLALVALLAGAQRSLRLGRGVALVLVAGLAFGLTQRAVHQVTFAGGFWPTYREYVGNKGEQSLVELVQRNRDPVVHEARTTLTNYFTVRRTGWGSDVRRAGPENGGLCLVPIALLGLVGLAAVCRRLRRQWPWLAMAALGLALPALSATTARRMLVFDLAWCAFAAHGLLAVLDGVGRRFTRAARARAAVAAVLALAVWSTIATLGASAAMSPKFGEHIPFGDAGFGDVLSCKRCLEAARGWQRDIADGAFVVLFDNDAVRENRTSPGGLPAYGKIAALAAGSTRRFVEAYALMGNWDIEPPDIGTMFDSWRHSFADELATRIEHAAPSRIVWHFERATTWERWLAERLRDAGGELETFSTPLGPRGGIRVTTPWSRHEAALAVIRELAIGPGQPEPACFRLEPRPTDVGFGPVFLLATDDAGLDRPPEWLIGSWSDHRWGTYRFTTGPTPIGVHMMRVPNAFRRVWLLGTHGELTSVDLPSQRAQDYPTFFPALQSGLDCGAHVDGHWWAIEPMTGKLLSTHEAIRAVPKGPWIGIAARGANELVLASAAQEVLVYDLDRKVEVVRFPARVSPSVRDTVDECTPIAVGADWVGLVNLRTSVMSVYDWGGRDLGTSRLGTLVPGNRGLSTIGGAGHYLGVSSGPIVRTFELRVDSACAAKQTATR